LTTSGIVSTELNFKLESHVLGILNGATTFSITTLSINGLFVTLSITIVYIQCHFAECRDLFIVTLNVITLSYVMLNVVSPFWPNVIRTNVVGTKLFCTNIQNYWVLSQMMEFMFARTGHWLSYTVACWHLTKYFLNLEHKYWIYLIPCWRGRTNTIDLLVLLV